MNAPGCICRYEHKSDPMCPHVPPTSNLVSQINAWLKSDAGKKFACVRDGYYRPPEDGCVGCLLKAAASALSATPETSVALNDPQSVELQRRYDELNRQQARNTDWDRWRGLAADAITHTRFLGECAYIWHRLVEAIATSLEVNSNLGSHEIGPAISAAIEKLRSPAETAADPMPDMAHLDAVQLRRIIGRHVRFREEAVRLLQQVDTDYEGEWPEIRQFLERVNARPVLAVKSSGEVQS